MNEQLRRAANGLVFLAAGLSMLATSSPGDPPIDAFATTYSAMATLPPVSLSNSESRVLLTVHIDATGSEALTSHSTTARITLEVSHSDPAPQMQEDNTPWVTATTRGPSEETDLEGFGGAENEMDQVRTTSGAFLRQAELNFSPSFEGNCREGALSSDPCTSSTTIVLERAITADEGLESTVRGTLEVTVEAPAASDSRETLPWSIEVSRVNP